MLNDDEFTAKWNALSDEQRTRIFEDSNKVVNDVLIEFAKGLLSNTDKDPFVKLGENLKLAVRWALLRHYMD